MNTEKLASLNIINAHSLEENGIYVVSIDTTAEMAQNLSDGLNEICKDKNIRFVIVNAPEDINFRIMELEAAIDRIPIDELELSVRTYNLLKRAGADTIGQAIRLNRSAFPMSERTWEELDEAVWEYRQRMREIKHD